MLLLILWQIPRWKWWSLKMATEHWSAIWSKDCQKVSSLENIRPSKVIHTNMSLLAHPNIMKHLNRITPHTYCRSTICQLILHISWYIFVKMKKIHPISFMTSEIYQSHKLTKLLYL
jgi:hypothetical protein